MLPHTTASCSKNNTCVDSWQRIKARDPAKANGTQTREQHEQTLTAMWTKLQYLETISRYRMVYWPTRMRMISQYYNNIVDGECIVHEQRVAEVELLTGCTRLKSTR